MIVQKSVGHLSSFRMHLWDKVFEVYYFSGSGSSWETRELMVETDSETTKGLTGENIDDEILEIK